MPEQLQRSGAVDPAKLIARSAELAERGPGIRFEIDAQGEPLPAFVVRYRGRVYAFVNRCAHISLQLDLMPGRLFDTSGRYLICAAHGALYEPDTGRCAGGPCNGAGLEPLGVIEKGGCIVLLDRVLAGTCGSRRGAAG